MQRREFVKKTILGALGFSFIRPAAAYAAVRPAVNIPDPVTWKDDEVNIAWLGHSTVLMNFFGKTIITDPVLYSQVGFQIFGITIGPSRFTQPALTVDNIPRPDLVLLSHAHMDHMDTKTLDAICSRWPGAIDCVTAFNTEDVISYMNWKSLKEIDWDEQLHIADVSIKAIRVKHFGWRMPWEKDRSKGFINDGRSFNAYLLERNGHRILFGGDTAFTNFFKDNSITADIAIMPIGAYYPWRMNHCSPEEALQMAADTRAKYFIPIHCNTFRQGMEPIEEPITRLLTASSNHNMILPITEIGQTFKLQGIQPSDIN